MQAFNITGIVVAGFFIFFILFRKKRKLSDNLLIAINLLTIGFLALDILVRDHLTITTFFIQALLPFYFFPLFLFFALETISSRPTDRARRWLIFLPAWITTLYIGIDLYFLNQYDEASLSQLYNDPPWIYHLLYKSNQLFFIVSLIWLIRRLKVFGTEIRESFSFTDPIQLNWLTHFSWIYLVITTISLTTFIIANLRILAIDIQGAYGVVNAFLVPAIFYISFHGIRQYSIAEYYGIQPPEPVLLNKENSGENEKYRNSSLTEHDQTRLYQELLLLFEGKAIYREPKLQLHDVAETLGVSPHSISQTINTKAGKPFYDFVNGYRVNHLQKLLLDPSQKRFTILALGLESGFNSKASMNRIFKEATKVSPSRYQKDQLRNL